MPRQVHLSDKRGEEDCTRLLGCRARYAGTFPFSFGLLLPCLFLHPSNWYRAIPSWA